MSVQTSLEAPAETTRYLAEFILGPAAKALSPDVLRATRHIILDTVACAIGGRDTDLGRSYTRWKVQQGGVAESTVVVSGQKIPMAAAANVNSQLANVLDADETLHNFAHFASTIVMPAIAAAEAVGATGEELIAAVAVGFDIAARIGVAIPEYGTLPSGEVTRFPGGGFSWAALGTAAAVGRLLQLSADQMTQALSIAFVTTPSHACLVSWGASLGQQAAPWHKYAMYGAIAEAGVNAALLARGGFVGGSGVLDRGSGFWRAFGAADFDWDTFYADLGHRWYIAETSIKPYPFCRYGNAALDLFGAVMKENGLAPTDVDEVVVTVAPYDWLVMLFGTEPPASAIDAAFCLPFAFAMLASNIPAGPDWQSLENLENTDLAAFARKVRHEVEPQWREGLETQIREVGRFRRMPVRVEVLAGGRIHAMQTDCAKGDPYAETRLSDDELALKVHNFCDKALTPGRVDELIAVAYALVEHTSVTTLTGLLSN